MTGDEFLSLGPVLAVVAGAGTGGVALPERWSAPLSDAGLVDHPAGSPRWRLSEAGVHWWSDRSADSRALLWTVDRELVRAWRDGREPRVADAVSQQRPALWVSA